MSDSLVKELAAELPVAHGLTQLVEVAGRELEATAAAYSRGEEDADVALRQAAIAYAESVAAMDEWLNAPVSPGASVGNVLAAETGEEAK